MKRLTYASIVPAIVFCIVFSGMESQGYSRPADDTVLQSSHAGTIESLVLIYTWSAEMGVVSLVDILTALPEANTVIISQFDPATDAFTVFQSRVAGKGLGFNRYGEPRLEFIQDARPYGPWPRDQGLVDGNGMIVISDSDQHGLKAVLPNIEGSFDLEIHRPGLAFAGSNLLVCGDGIIASERVPHKVLALFSSQMVIRVPAPPEPEAFHLDLIAMPISDSVVVVGDDRPVRDLFLTLSDAEISELVIQWLTEVAVSANNIRPRISAGRMAFEQTGEPPLILPRLAAEKMDGIRRLLNPHVFRTAVREEPEYVWDDRIAAALIDEGFDVLRVPMWPGGVLSGIGQSRSPLPVITYPNLLVWDDGIIMPVYGIPELDDTTRRILEDNGNRPVHPMRGGVILGFGSSGPHCLTLEVRNN